VSDTPRTDAAARLVRTTENGVLVHANFARELERENAALRGLLQDSLEWLDDYGMHMSGTSNLVSRIETVLRKEVEP